MKITVCLVTKGRNEYIQDCISSIEEALKIPEVFALVIANGCDSKTLDFLQEWTNRNANKSTLIERSVNTPRPDQIFPLIAQTNPDWVIFPGDDDILIPNVILSAIEKIKLHDELVAISFSAKIIDENGRETGELIQPSGLSSENEEKLLGRAFSEPPSIWPSLLFKFQSITEKLPTSRLAFDWWVSINLILAGKIEFSQESAMYYRRHSDQESSVVPAQRKYLEAYIWLRYVLESKSFQQYINGKSSEQLDKFWHKALESGPIYGDSRLGQHLLVDLGLLLSKNTESDESRARYLAEIAKINQVILFGNEVSHLGDFAKEFESADIRNFHFVTVSKTCPILIELIKSISDSSKNENIEIGCSHSMASEMKIDCVRISSLGKNEQLIMLNLELSKLLLERDSKSAYLSIGEKILLSRLRLIRKRLPGRLRNVLRKFRD